MKDKFYMTTAITYASQKPHIGNTYEIILADAIKRFKQLEGYDVFLLTGTDEHGEKVEQLAKKSKESPQSYVDNISGQIKEIWDKMNTTYDKFIRTSSPAHKEIVAKIFRKLYEQGDIYKGRYEGLYCIPCESFFTTTQAQDGKCPDCGRELKKTSEEAYFFRMSKYSDRLLKYIEDNPSFIEPQSRKNEMVNNFLKPGLEDLCVSRTSFSWGVSVDFDKKHIVYVWIDALSNYITALGYNPDGESDELFKKLWPADLHIIGKDIIRFHTIYWPIILMALGLPLPKKVLGHPWLLSGEDKMSKSLGNVIYADDLVSYFGLDAVRFYLLYSMPYANDGKISYESIISVNNSELANTLGNLVKRTCDMIVKYFNGRIERQQTDKNFEKNYIDSDLKKSAQKTIDRYKSLMDSLKVSEAIGTVMGFARRCNKYIDETTPWILAKDEKQKTRLSRVLYNLAESIRKIAVMLEPVIPDASKEIMNQIGAFGASDDLFAGLLKGDEVNEVNVKKTKVLFERIDMDKKLKELEKTKKEDKSGLVSITDFEKLDLVVGEIKDCRKIKNSVKLYKLRVDVGKCEKNIVSGIANCYKEEELIGRKIVLVNNLKPVKLCGESSEGMLLAANDGNDGIKVIFVDSELQNGAVVR